MTFLVLPTVAGTVPCIADQMPAEASTSTRTAIESTICWRRIDVAGVYRPEMRVKAAALKSATSRGTSEEQRNGQSAVVASLRSPSALHSRLDLHDEAYQRECRETLISASEGLLWSIL